jgi:hypothetical protein
MENMAMTYVHHYLGFSALALVVLFPSTACPAWIIDADDSCTWGIANSEPIIPAGFIPVGAILTLHDVFMDTSVSSPTLNIYLLHNPDPGLVKLAGILSCDPFEGYGTPLSRFSQLTSPGQDLAIDFAQVNDPQSQIWSVFSNPFTRTLGNQNIITYSSALLELLDYSGSGKSFGFGLYSQGFVCSGLMLQITVQSLTDTQTVTITFEQINHPPVLNSTRDIQITEGTPLSMQLSAADPDNDPLTFSIISGPAWLSVSANGILAGTPSGSDVGTVELTIQVDDGAGGTASAALTITVQPVPTWTRILYDDFESGMGNWIDGGANCIRYVGSSYAHQGSGALNLQDHTSTSVATTNKLALSKYTKIKVDFWYKCISMDSKTEDFWLQISTNGGTSYTTVEEWNYTDEFINGQYYQDSVIITGRTLTDQTRIRFRCDASAKDDDVYIDQIAVWVQ